MVPSRSLFMRVLSQVRPFIDGKYLKQAGEAHAANRHYSLLLSRIETMMWEIQWASELVRVESVSFAATYRLKHA